jgi:hypothetical protein
MLRVGPVGKDGPEDPLAMDPEGASLWIRKQGITRTSDHVHDQDQRILPGLEELQDRADQPVARFLRSPPRSIPQVGEFLEIDDGNDLRSFDVEL